MSYYWIRQLHLATVIFTIAFFCLRLSWAWLRPALVERRGVRILSASNDTLLLVAGITLMVMTHQYPWQAPWIAAKLGALLLYILFGYLALHGVKSTSSRAVWSLSALASIGYMLGVALSRSPMPDFMLAWERIFGE